MATIHQHPAAMPPMPAVARILSRFDRERLSGFIEVAIGLLDVMEGDVDLNDGINADLSECGPEDTAADISYPEWHTRGRHKLYRGRGEIGPTAKGFAHVHEDDEDDDPDTGVEDNPLGCDPEEDCCMAGDDLARGGPIVLDGHWEWAVSSGRQPGDADDHEPWQGSRETVDYVQPRDYVQPQK